MGRQGGFVGRRWVARGALIVLMVAVALVGPVSGVAAQIHTVEAGDTLQRLADDHDVSVEELAAANGLDPSDPVAPGAELIVPSAAPAASPSSGTVIDGVPAYQQARSLSCEYAAVYIATSVFGNPIAEQDYLDATPQSSNPHLGYRGDIDGLWGNTDDYGIYAEALVPNLESHGFVGAVSYGADAGALRAQLDAGHPTLVWIATRGDTSFYAADDSGTYKLVPYEHVVVAYGYDDSGVALSDLSNVN